MYDNNIIHDNGMFGTWTDAQIPNTYLNGETIRLDSGMRMKPR